MLVFDIYLRKLGGKKFGNLCLVDYFSVVTMLIGIVFYIVGKPVYLPLQ